MLVKQQFLKIKMIYILGGGPTGIAVAHELNNISNSIFIDWKRDKIGGLAQC